MTFKIPKSIDEINSMISNKIMESIHIDYKAGKALSGKAKEISKDISAFANSDGGYVIYGVSEKEHLPTSIDEGVDHKAKGRKKGSKLE